MIDLVDTIKSSTPQIYIMREMADYAFNVIKTHPDLINSLHTQINYLRQAGIDELTNLYHQAEILIQTSQPLIEASKHHLYGIKDGIWDGFSFYFNLGRCARSGDYINGASWARDGHGLRSDPNTSGYWFGYIMGSAADTFAGLFVMKSLFPHK